MHTLNKQAVREAALARRAALTPSQRSKLSRQIAAHALCYVNQQAAQTVFIYAATEQEVDTADLIAALLQNGQTVCLPRCSGHGVMEAYAITAMTELKPGRYNILEPPSRISILSSDIDLAFVPGCLFGRDGSRMGYGGGYYDRFLPQCLSACYVGLSFSACLTESVPCEEHDVRMHRLITEHGVMNIL